MPPIDLRVVDRDGRFADDLTKDEFRIFEDGRAQTITTFALINIPTAPGPAVPAGPRVEPDVASNVEPAGRLYVIILDDLEDQATRSVQRMSARLRRSSSSAI